MVNVKLKLAFECIRVMADASVPGGEVGLIELEDAKAAIFGDFLAEPQLAIVGLIELLDRASYPFLGDFRDRWIVRPVDSGN